MADLENDESLENNNEENNKTVISSITYSEEERIKISNNDDIHRILAEILCK